MTDPNAHYDDLTEAGYEKEARYLAFNEDEASVDPNIAARKRELRTLLDRLTPSIADIELVGDYIESGVYNETGRSLEHVMDAALAFRARLIRAQQWLSK